MNIRSLSMGVVLAFALSACAIIDPQLKGEPVLMPVQPAGTRATPIRFGRLEGRMRHGTEIGRYAWGILCKPPYRTITWETGRRLISNSEYGARFYDSLSSLGYDVAGDPGRMYDEDADIARAELVVSGQVDEIAMDVCRRYDWWFDEYTGYTGAAVIRVNWTVYNKLEQRPIYQTTTTGYGKLEDTSADARELLMERAFSDASLRLGQQEGFRRTVFRPVSRATAPALDQGAPPPKSEAKPETAPILAPRPSLPRPAEPNPDPEVPPDPWPDLPQIPVSDGLKNRMPPDRTAQRTGLPEPELRRGEDAPEAQSDQPGLGTVPVLRIERQPTRSGPFTENAEALVKATVVIATGYGDGSGFFIGRDPAGGGWILTNAHVVGDAERVRVSTSNRRARIGTVLRRHRMRDVALVHVDGEIPALVSIRDEVPAVGEEVYAVGEPLGPHNRNTVTRGIVSRYTKQSRTGLSWLQSDVTTQHGSSGGPLTDGSGNVVAVDVAGIMSMVDRTVGLNYFIPISDALEKLKIEIAGKP